MNYTTIDDIKIFLIKKIIFEVLVSNVATIFFQVK